MSPTDTYFTDLTDQSLLLIQGPDAGKFLQGQVTCDINELGEHARHGAHCSVKGRVIFNFIAMQLGPEQIALRLAANMLSVAQASLGKYIVFSKAKLNTGTDFRGLGIWGAGADQIIAQLFAATPAETLAVIKYKNNYCIKINQSNYECWFASEDFDTARAAISALTQAATIHAWKHQQIALGLAEITPEISERFTPQDLNMQLTGAVNFRKGCYTGQEIVARLHYRGKLKKHLYRFAYSGPHPAPELAPGSNLISEQGQHAGEIVNIAPLNDANFELLASVFDEHLENLRPENSAQKLRLLPLPYAIPKAESAD